MADDNAYSPAKASTYVTNRNTNWLRRFVVLNAVLLGMPLLFIATAWLALSANGTELSGTSGSIGIATLAVVGCYFIVPNLVVLLVWAIRHARTPRSQS